MWHLGKSNMTSFSCSNGTYWVPAEVIDSYLKAVFYGNIYILKYKVHNHMDSCSQINVVDKLKFKETFSYTF